MSYKKLGHDFLHYFVDCINLKQERLLPCLKQDTMLTINTKECLGKHILPFFNLIKFHNLRIEAKHVLVQPIFWANSNRQYYNGILILVSGNVNVLENGLLVNKNVHLTFTLENIQGRYYINNMMIRLSEKSRQIQQNNIYNNYQMITDFS